MIVDLSSQNWNLKGLREMFRQGSELDLSTTIKDESEILAVLPKIHEKYNDDFAAIRDSDQYHKHVHFTFGTACDISLAVEFCSCDLDVSIFEAESYPGVRIIVISGTLNAWKREIVHHTTGSSPLSVFFCKVHEILGHRGFSHVFSDYRRVPTGLEKK